MSVMLRSMFLDLLKTNVIIEEIFYSQWQEEQPVFEQLFNLPPVVPKKSVTDTQITGFDVLAQKDEASDINFDQIYQGYDTTYTFLGYGLGFAISHELQVDEQYGIIKQLPAMLALSAIRTPDILAADIFNNGGSLNSLFLSGGDGVALFSGSHPRPDGGGTIRNDAENAADLSVTSLQEHMVAFSKITGGRGEYLDLEPATLLVPVDLQPDAEEILGSPDRPDTAERAINVLHNKLKIVSWKRLTDADTWFLLAAKGKHALNARWREKPSDGENTKGWMEEKSMNYLFRTYLRIAFGHSDFRGAYRVQGV